MKKYKDYQEWLDNELKNKGTTALSVPVFGWFLYLVLFQFVYPYLYLRYALQTRPKTKKQLIKIKNRKNRKIAKEIAKQIINPTMSKDKFLKNCEESFKLIHNLVEDKDER